jgi:hypothetical protein
LSTSPACSCPRPPCPSSAACCAATCGHLKKIRSRWRTLPAGKIAAIVLAVLRHDQRLAVMAGGNRISATTVRRWVMEVIGLLAARAPRLERALRKVTRKGGHVVLIDGTLIRTRRRTGSNPVVSTGCKDWRILTKVRLSARYASLPNSPTPVIRRSRATGPRPASREVT